MSFTNLIHQLKHGEVIIYVPKGVDMSANTINSEKVKNLLMKAFGNYNSYYANNNYYYGKNPNEDSKYNWKGSSRISSFTEGIFTPKVIPIDGFYTPLQKFLRRELYIHLKNTKNKVEMEQVLNTICLKGQNVRDEETRKYYGRAPKSFDHWFKFDGLELEKFEEIWTAEMFLEVVPISMRKQNNMFVKGEYVVIQNFNDMHPGSAFKDNHVYKVRETKEFLRVEVDFKGSKTNGNAKIRAKAENEYWRYATTKEIELYESKNFPQNVNDTVKWEDLPLPKELEFGSAGCVENIYSSAKAKKDAMEACGISKDKLDIRNSMPIYIRTQARHKKVEMPKPSKLIINKHKFKLHEYKGK